MKKKLFSSVVIFFFLFCNAFSASYWSNTQDGPYSVESAIKDKLSGRKLDPIEGIWFDDGLGNTVIFKDDRAFITYVNSLNSYWK